MSEGTMARITMEITELERRIDTELQKLSGKYTARTISTQLAKIDVGCSKGIQHLLAENSDCLKTSGLLSELKDVSSEAAECGNDDAITNKSNTSSQNESGEVRGILRDVLDGLVEPELLDSCVEDLHILTQHSGTKMCQLLSEAEETRNQADIGSDQKLPAQDVDSKPSDAEDTRPNELPVKDKNSLKLPVFIPSSVVPKQESKSRYSLICRVLMK
ncbi:unnamed protein product [Trichobilharzia regenti]|nr:unnamed protein product [Trichobilharzia regenti]